MLVLLTKANHDTWHKYKEFNTIEELFKYINYNSIEFVTETWNTTIEDAYKINSIKWEVEIYNSYVE